MATTDNDDTVVHTDASVLDLVLGEWLSITSLPAPKFLLVRLCYNAVVDDDILVTSDPTATTFGIGQASHHRHSNKKSKYLRVEAQGSGVEIVPTWAFDSDTMTINDLFLLVRRHLERGLHFRLLYRGDKELKPDVTGGSLLTTVVDGVVDNADDYVFSVVVVDFPEWSLQRCE